MLAAEHIVLPEIVLRALVEIEFGLEPIRLFDGIDELERRDPVRVVL